MTLARLSNAVDCAAPHVGFDLHTARRWDGRRRREGNAKVAQERTSSACLPSIMLARLIVQTINRGVYLRARWLTRFIGVSLDVALVAGQLGRVARRQVVAKLDADDVFIPKHPAFFVGLLGAEQLGAQRASDKLVNCFFVDDICRHWFAFLCESDGAQLRRHVL